MTGLTDTQASVLRTLFATAPDSAVQTLERALSEEAMSGGPMSAVYGLIAEEVTDRRAKQIVFEPLIALCGPRGFPPSVLKALWAGVRQACPAEAEAAVGYVSKKRMSEENLIKAIEVYDRLCEAAALGLREGGAAFSAAARILEGDRPDGVTAFAMRLDLTPLVRAAIARLPEWFGRMTGDRAAAVKVAYKDAVTIAEDAGPRFIEMLAANLPEPWMIMRILSAVMDHPGEGFLAASELAQFAEQILDDIDRRLAQFRAFDPDGGREAGLEAGEAIQFAAMEIVEFEESVELNREGPWGRRIMQQKQSLAQLAETRLAQIDKALDVAMPLRSSSLGRVQRGLPRLTEDPNPAAVRRAQALMAFFDFSRHAASQSGYGAARAKAAERIEARLDQYIEDLLELLRARPIEAPERVRGYLEVAAALMEAARGQKAGQIVRRRAAAA